MQTRFNAVYLLPLPLLLAACGDDLESRNAAVGADSFGGGRDIAITERTDGVSSGGRIISGANATSNRNAEAAPAARAGGDVEEDGPPTINAEPRDLIISTDGFAPEPMDDAAGFAPEPTAPEPFNPNPVPAQPVRPQ